MNFAAYEAQANSIDINTITNDKINREILHRLRANDPTLTEVGICDLEAREDDASRAFHYRGAEAAYEETRTYYCPINNIELGWLGFFIGRNTQVVDLRFYCSGINIEIDGGNYSIFREGMSHNRSIEDLAILGMDMSDELICSLEPFIKNSGGITSIAIEGCFSSTGTIGQNHLALAFGSCMNKCLKDVSIVDSAIEDEYLVNIVEAIGTHLQLEEITLNGNDGGKKTCRALRNILLQPNTVLHTLGTSWDDDDDLEILLSGLVGNCRLKKIPLCGITAKGWKAIKRLLCDTSSINNTYLSNHTLEEFQLSGLQNDDLLVVRHLLSLNGREDKHRVAMEKILYYHSDFDMQPFFEWEFKALPIAIDWFTKAAAQTTGFEEKIKRSKLSAIYQFIRDMPVLYVEAHLRKDLEDITVKESLLEEEEERLRRQLQDIPRRRQILHDQKKSITQKLGVGK